MNTSETLISGKTVGGGRYILNKQIGEHSSIWLAHDEVDNKPVVLTFLPPELYSDPRGLEELRNQVNVVRELSHPNIGNIYDIYEAEGEEPFISSEYIEGMNLRALQQMQPNRVYGWTFLFPLLKQIYAALQLVHDNNLIQGSLKPSQLMLDRKGQIKLLDAGIAGILNNPLYAGPPQAGSGLLPYLSPQQIDGAPPEVTDDIYSLGVTIYELLTSTVPFHTGDILPQIRNSEPQQIEQRLAQLKVSNPVPPLVSSMITACLAKDPAARPQNIETLAKSLDIAELPPPETPRFPAPKPSSRPVPEAPKGPAPVAQPPAPAKKPVMLIASIAAVVLALGVGTVWFFKSGPKDGADTGPGATEDAAAEARGRRIAKEGIELLQLASRTDSGSIPLFNGRDLNGWSGDPNFWSVTDGTISGQTPANAPSGLNTCLTWTGGNVSDFEFRFQYKFKMLKNNALAQGGVVYRGKKIKDWEVTGYECLLSLNGDSIGLLSAKDRPGFKSFMQKAIVTDAGGTDKVQFSGNLVPFAMVQSALKKEDWNECVITAQGNHFIHKINGHVVADLVDHNEKRRANSGLLALQLNTGTQKAVLIQFKNLQLKKLTK